MTLHALLNFFRKYPLGLILGVDREVNRFYHACFLSALLAQPFARLLAEEDQPSSALARVLGMPEATPELEAWLDFGVSVKLLRKRGERYGVRNRLARKLALGHEPWRAYYRLRVEAFNRYILDGPSMAATGQRFELDDSLGELYAVSSRTVEPLLLDVTRDVTPRSGPVSLLEAGCGSGVYIRAACAANPDLTAVGLETQHSTAELARRNMAEWGLSGRVGILDTDLREYDAHNKHDLVTMYNLIYYFAASERQDLFKHAASLLKPGGRIVLTSLDRGEMPSIRAMHLWSSLNRRGGPLPSKQELVRLLKESGLRDVESRELIPNYLLFTARRPDKDNP